jgi:hypothetical protein
MLTSAFPFLLRHHIECDLPAKLRVLADDLDKIRRGIGPSVSDLAAAPLLVDWRGVLSPLGLCLAGFVAGHPILGNRHIQTSQIWAADDEGHWIRTLSRYYRLGVPAGAHLLATGDEPGDYDGTAGERND